MQRLQVGALAFYCRLTPGKQRAILEGKKLLLGKRKALFFFGNLALQLQKKLSLVSCYLRCLPPSKLYLQVFCQIRTAMQRKKKRKSLEYLSKACLFNL